MKYALFLWVVFAASGQTSQPEPASVSGVVRDAASGAPLPDGVVTLTIRAPAVAGQPNPAKNLTAKCDSQGRYEFSDVPAGSGSIQVLLDPKFFPINGGNITLRAGQKLSFDPRIKVRGTISGKVLDEDGEPVPQMTVFLVRREYVAGAVRTLVRGSGTTNDTGEYLIERVEAGRPHLLYATRWPSKLPPSSDVPDDVRMRRHAYAAAYYPNSPDLNGAAPVVLRSGQALESINLKVTKKPAFCVDATLETMGVPGPLTFDIAPEEPRDGTGNNDGMYMRKPGGTAGSDGRIRICDLTPGAYTLQAFDERTKPQSIGSVTVVVSDRDLRGVKVQALPAQKLQGEFVWDGKPPAEPVPGQVPILVESLKRAHFNGESVNARGTVPSTFSLDAVPEGEYKVLVRPPAGLYIRDVTYNGGSILHGSLRVGSAMGDAGIRVLVGFGAGSIDALVTTQDDKPAAGVTVIALPANASTDAAMADGIMRGSTDQNGRGTINGLAPGKYFVMAIQEEVTMDPGQISRLWQARVTRATEVSVPLGGSASAEVKVAALD